MVLVNLHCRYVAQNTVKQSYHAMHFFLPFHWPRTHHVLNHQPQGKRESGPVLKHFLLDLHSTCNIPKHVKLLAPQEPDLVLFSPNPSAP